MKHKFLLLCFSIFLSVCAHAQRENNNWLFGNKAGLTWNTTQDFAATGAFGTANATLSGIPTTIASEINTFEGCFSISDVSGNLLFYSDGMKIWDKNNQVMPNGSGLNGHSSSAQSGIVVPYPGQANKYIVFALGFQNANNLSYSIVDMTLKGNGTTITPLGDVVSGQKNIPLTGHSGSLGESLTAVWDAAGNNVWLVAVGRTTTTC